MKKYVYILFVLFAILSCTSQKKMVELNRIDIQVKNQVDSVQTLQLSTQIRVYYFVNYYNTNSSVNPERVNWDTITKENFPIRDVQEPGNQNALGLVKFIMPNKHAIYMHDTPSDYLFHTSQRDFSHGCICLEKPFELAESLLQNHEQISSDSLTMIQSNLEPYRVFLKDEFMAYFTYLTAWVEKDKILYFRDDIYQLDEKQFPPNKANQPLQLLKYKKNWVDNHFPVETDKKYKS